MKENKLATKMKPPGVVSIIVPVYNVEKYLEQCLRSIIDQSYVSLEIILINDGSTDCSLDICKTFQKKDGRIMVVNQENLGVSAARNVGLAQAKGEYISFIDPDDLVHKEYIKKLYDNLIECNADISVCERKRFIINEPSANNNNKSTLYILSGQKARLETLYSKIFSSVWGKLYRKDVLRNIRFNESLRASQDLEFLDRALKNAKTVIVSLDKLYYYRLNPESTMLSKGKLDKRFDSIHAVNLIEDERDKDMILAKKCRLYSESALILNMLIFNREKYKSDYLRLRNNIKEARSKVLCNNYMRKIWRLHALIATLNIELAIYFFVALFAIRNRRLS